MTVKGRFSLDTNILIYAVDRDAGERHERSKEIVARAALHDCVLTVQALAEFFHATTRKNLLALSHAGTFVRDWIDVFRVVSATDTAFINAIEGVEEHRLAFWDALLWATGSTKRLLRDHQRRHAGRSPPWVASKSSTPSWTIPRRVWRLCSIHKTQHRGRAHVVTSDLSTGYVHFNSAYTT